MRRVWKVLKPLLEVGVAIVIVLVLILVPTLSGQTLTTKDSLNGVVPSVAAGTGPLVGDQSLWAEETACVEDWAADPANNYVGYWPAIGAPEHTDNVRSGLMPCGSFTGDFDGPNQVFQYKSESTYPGGIGLVVFDGPTAGYMWVGGIVPGSGEYIARFDPSTGEEVWRTYLTNVNLSDQWLALGSLAIIADGSLAAAASNWFWKMDRVTGEILAAEAQPINGSTPASSHNFDGMVVAPDEQGTLLMKSQTRPEGCTTQTNSAMSACADDYGPNPPSVFVAVDPATMKNLDSIEINQNVTARSVAVEHDGKIYMYGNGAESLVRVIWDPETQTLTQDMDWLPEVILDGQTGGASPVVMGDWVIANSNANGSTETPQCVFAVHQDDPTDIHQSCPWGTEFPVRSGATTSDTVAAPGIDPETSTIYLQDYFLKGVHAIHLDQETGEMEIKWSRDDWWTSDYFTLVGPRDQRVLVSQNIDPSTTTANIATGFNYDETVLWVDAATGETIAESATNPSTAVGSLINIGYGGRYYTMGNDGSLFIYQVQSCEDGTTVPEPMSATNCSTDYSTLPQPRVGDG